jgi:hypothetical protein
MYQSIPVSRTVDHQPGDKRDARDLCRAMVKGAHATRPNRGCRSQSNPPPISDDFRMKRRHSVLSSYRAWFSLVSAARPAGREGRGSIPSPEHLSESGLARRLR